MLWAVATMCFFGFLRSGEVVVPSDRAFKPTVHLAYADVRIDSQVSPRMLEVRLKASKTDPFQRGVTIYIGRMRDGLCPVAVALDYMVQRGSGQGPLFLFEDGRYLTRERFVVAVRMALRKAGLDPTRYAGHSLRITAATSAAQRGIQDSLIKRWDIGRAQPTQCMSGHPVRH